MAREKILQIAKPMLYNTEMTIAILDYSKTATRRIAKNITSFDNQGTYFNVFRRGEWTGPIARDLLIETYAPYKVGDYLYVREAWSKRSFGYVYKADGKEIDHLGNVIKWRPSIHMPKEAARIFLRVKDVRIEQLQAMTLGDFLSEGVVLRPEAFNDPENAYQQAKRIFIGIWDSTTNKLTYKWDASPWVWAIEFERIYPND